MVDMLMPGEEKKKIERTSGCLEENSWDIEDLPGVLLAEAREAKQSKRISGWRTTMLGLWLLPKE